jgi:hypothetical protein
MTTTNATGSTQLDALATERRLRTRLAEFAQSTAFLRDQKLSDACRQLWESDERNGGLVGQLWVEGIFPSRGSGYTARELATNGLLDSELVAQLGACRRIPLESRIVLPPRTSHTA